MNCFLISARAAPDCNAIASAAPIARVAKREAARKAVIEPSLMIPWRHGGIAKSRIQRLARLRRQSENTYSTVPLRWSFSSGVLTMCALAFPLGPVVIARYCLPLTANVIGGA